jgi:phosphatidylserine decarboxylase
MPDRWRHRLLIAAVRRLPQHVVSRLAGRAASWRLPPPLQRLEIRAFGRAVGVDFSEVRDPLDSFRTLQDFFTRALLPGARPIDPDPDAVVAPCDGFWGTAGAIERGTLLQVKGRPYSLARLLGSEDEAARFSDGAYATFYLSPRDYHRFHAPCAAHVVRAVYLPGGLWPVNQAGLESVDALFARNERIAATLQPPSGGRICMVAVGATLVGKVRLTFDDLTTNLPGAAPARRDYPPPGHALAKGEEWGRFEFGSTIVLVAAAGTMRLVPEPPGSPLRLGRRIGSLLTAPLPAR